MKAILGFTFLICVFLWFQKDDFEAEQKASEHKQHVLSLAKKEKAENDKQLKHLYIEAQYKTGFPAKERVAVNP